MFGAWEGNWIAFNDAHDVALPGSNGAPVGFLMYPQAESAAGRADCLDAANFSYTIDEPGNWDLDRLPITITYRHGRA